jgi:hypothetical protein
MGASAGPNLVGIGRGGASNLVLEMDAHDAKSYPGEPTTNLIAYPHYTGATLDTGQTGTNGGWGATWGYEISEIPGPNGTTVRAFSIELTAVVSPFTYSASGTPYNVTGINSQYAAMTSGTTYTASCWAKVEKVSGGSHTDENLLYFTGASSIGAPSMTVGPEWTHISSTVTPGATGNYRLYHYFYSVAIGDKIWFTMPQIEQKGYATPFVRSQLLDFSQQGYSARPASTNLIIHGDVGTGQTFSDSSPSKHTITANGGVTHSAAQSKFTGGSISFDGNGDYLSIAPSSDFNFGEEDFTLDVWIMRNALTNDDTIWGNGVAEADATCMLYFNGSGHLRFFQAGGTLLTTTSTGISTGTWYHVALVRNGTNLSIYVDGVSKGSLTLSNYNTGQASQSVTTVSGSGTTWTSAMVGRTFDFASSPTAGIVTSFTSATELEVTVSQTVGSLENYNIAYKFGSSSQSNTIGTRNGSGTAYDWDGYMDEYRITKGTALWLNAFTPPTRRNLSAPVVDRSGNHNGINLINGTDSGGETYRVGEVIRPIDTAVWDFDGTDDYAIAGDSDDWNFGTGAFAIEQWLRFTDFTPSGDGWVTTLQQYAAEADRNGWLLFYNNGSNFEWRLECTAPTPSFYPTHVVTSCSLNTWYLFTISREGSSFKMYINGDLRLTDTSNPTFTNIAGPMYVGNYAAGDPHEFQGQMGALRIYKGGALTDQQVVENFNQQRSRFKV